MGALGNGPSYLMIAAGVVVASLVGLVAYRKYQLSGGCPGGEGRRFVLANPALGHDNTGFVCSDDPRWAQVTPGAQAPTGAWLLYGLG